MKTSEMPKKTADQIKMYIVIGLSLTFALVGYLQLIHGKTEPETTTPSPADSTAPEFEKQIVEPMTWQQEDWHARLAAEPVRQLKRDIFRPAIDLKSRKSEPLVAKSAVLIPKLKLRGTVVGGEKPIAIIDDTFIRKDEWIAGYKVVWIGKRTVVLSSGENKLVLELLPND